MSRSVPTQGDAPTTRIGREEWIYFILGIVLAGLTMLAWQCVDNRPPRWDESTYLFISQHSYQALQEGHVIDALSLKDVSNTKTGGISFLSAITYFVAGDSPRIATFLVNFTSIGLVLWSLLRGGQLLWRQPGLGLIAWCAFLLNSVVAAWMGYYQVDLPMTAVAALVVVLCLWLRNNNEAPAWVAPTLAFSIAVGMATKHLFVAFVAGALFLLFLEHWFFRPFTVREKWRFYGPTWLWIGVGVLAGIGYHLLNWHIVAEQLARSRDVARTGASSSAPPIWQIVKQLLVLPIISWMPMITLASLAVIVGVWKRTVGIAYVALSVALGVAGVSKAASFPISYYFLPIVPWLYLLVAGGIALPTGWLRHHAHVFPRWAAMTVYLSLSAFLFAAATKVRLGTADPIKIAGGLPEVFAQRDIPKVNPFVEKDYWTHAYVDGNTAVLPYPHHWQVEEMFDLIASQVKAGANDSYTVASLTNYEWMSSDYLRFEIKRRDLRGRLNFVLALPSPQNGRDVVAGVDFVIFKTGKIWKEDFYALDWAIKGQQTADFLSAYDFKELKAAGFRCLKRYPLPDGSEGLVWASVERVINRSLLTLLPQARIDASPGFVSTSTFTIDDVTRKVLFAHPPPPPGATSVRWSGVEISDEAALTFGIALSADHWSPDKGDGVEFVIEVHDGNTTTMLFKQVIDPKHRAEDRAWHDHSVSLARWQGRQIDLVLKTSAMGDNAFDHAGWSGLVITRP